MTTGLRIWSSNNNNNNKLKCSEHNFAFNQLVIIMTIHNLSMNIFLQEMSQFVSFFVEFL